MQLFCRVHDLTFTYCRNCVRCISLCLKKIYIKKNQKVSFAKHVICHCVIVYYIRVHEKLFAMSAENGNKNSRKMCILLKSHKSFTATSLSTFLLLLFLVQVGNENFHFRWMRGKNNEIFVLSCRWKKRATKI